MRLLLSRKQGSGTIYWDDIRVYAEPAHDIDVANGNFEDGALSPWATYLSIKGKIATEQVHSGKFSLAESAGKGTVYQDVKDLVSGVRYTISAWVSGSPDATATAQIVFSDPGNGVVTACNTVNPKANWQLLKCEVKVSAHAQGVGRIHLSRSDGNGTIFWDDVQIARTE